MEKPTLFLVFDVESIGLHGEGFAVGYVVKRLDGEHMADGLFACLPDLAEGTDANRRWAGVNVPPLEANCCAPHEVRAKFWDVWLSWKARGAVLVADCAWPVEARFLAACVDDAPGERNWQGPYPLHDLASVLLAHGLDPLAATARRPEELPAHHPVNDAMQSARILVERLSTQRERSVWQVEPVDPEAGWRLLEKGERRQSGDEVKVEDQSWKPISSRLLGCDYRPDESPVRRRIGTRCYSHGCTLPDGHSGMHASRAGQMWNQDRPTPRCTHGVEMGRYCPACAEVMRPAVFPGSPRKG